MKKIKYPLAVDSWDQAELDAIYAVIKSGTYSMGNYVKDYEKYFAQYFGAKFAVMTSSGSTANLIATASLFFKKKNKLKLGDEIIVPAISWSTTYFPLQQYGLKLKFVDINLMTLNYDLNQLKSAVTDNTKAIMVVNLLGNPNNFNEIQEIVGERDIYLIEDNCESMGAEFKGKFTGTFGDLGTFSSFFSHHISTMEGGMVLTNNEELYHILLVLRAHGWTRNLPKRNKITRISDNPFLEQFRFILPGYNVRPLEFSGAIGLKQLEKLGDFITQRRENALLFQERFAEQESFFIQKEVGMSSWFGFSLIINPNKAIKRKDIIQKLGENSIDTRPIVSGNFTKNEVLRFFDYEIFGNLPNAEIVDNLGFFVGNSQNNLKEEINHLYKILKAFI